MGSATPPADPIVGDGVYKAFHEKAGIQRIIDDFIVRVTTDPQIAERFKAANLIRLRLELKARVATSPAGLATTPART